MGKNDMDHMQHLESVALSDCAVLQTKEATYQGSWKRAGGRSAWFMGRRNFDRLITMMQAKDFPEHVRTPQNVRDTLAALDHVVHYQGNGGWNLPGSIEATRMMLAMLGDAYFADDIFAMIALHPKGEDGTVLACVRDARRYLMLIEAEMIAEGVVEPESKTYEQETGMYRPPETNVYKMISDERGIPIEEVQERIRKMFYGDVPLGHPGYDTPEQRDAAGGGYAKEQAERHAEITSTETSAVISSGGVTRELDPNFTAVISEGKVYEHGRQRPATDADRALAADTFGGPRPTPSNGSHHAGLTPWQVGSEYYNRIADRIGLSIAELFYKRRAPNLYRLEPVVVCENLPKELATCYDFHGKNVWVLRRRSMPEELQDQYPKVQYEMNAKEFEGVGDFYFMYNLIGEKYTVSDIYREDWAV